MKRCTIYFASEDNAPVVIESKGDAFELDFAALSERYAKEHAKINVIEFSLDWVIVGSILF